MSTYVKSFSELSAEQQRLAGGKGGSLARLFQAGYPVPDGLVILPNAFVDDELAPEAWTELQSYLTRLRSTGPDMTFAVRSSAMSEDSAEASFAGEFETVLNMRTDDEIRQAIRTVYHSRSSERVAAYSQVKGIASDQEDGGHEIAVIIQEMVSAHASGVLFTAHPVTGQRDQAMISAAWGLGEAIVGGMVTPDILVVDKTTGKVLSRDTADKQTMTVLLPAGTEEQPVPEYLRRAPVLSDSEAAGLAAWGVQIETLYGAPMDIEWTLADSATDGEPGPQAQREFAIVQARPITALPAPEPPVPTEWELPEGSYMAIRNNIVELMAEPLSPLFRTLGLQAVNISLNRVMGSFFGSTDLMPDEIIIPVNEYAYYNGSWSGGQLGKILLNSVGIAKHMFTGAVERWTDDGRPHYIATVDRWQATDWRALGATDLLSAARELSEATVDAYGSLVSGVIPAAWITEALFTKLYNPLIKRRDDPDAPTYLLGFDSIPIQSEKALWDMAEWVRERKAMAAYLGATPAAELATQIENGQAPTGVGQDDWSEWQAQFRSYLKQYGHVIYNLDFSNAVPADDPSPVLETFKMFARGEGMNPYQRQASAAEKREKAMQDTLSRLKGQRLKLFRSTVERAQRYAPLREDGLADVGLSYPLLRKMLRELGRRLADGGMIEQPDDIFWLEQQEVAQAAAALDSGEALSCLGDIIPQRQAVLRSAKRATPPLSVSSFRVFGKELKMNKTESVTGKDKNMLKGVATSPGTVTAPACVLTEPEEFGRMKTGDVLVAAITTPAWTPLFARASAVVTDVGGPLSHGSIVAREYGIPAVLGTGSATKRIRSGQIITVDGTTGRVTLPEDEGAGM